MNSRWIRLAALAFAATMVAGACASEDDEGADGSDDGGSSDLAACQVTDTGGIDDASFNQTAYAGVERAEEELGVEARFLESTAEADYEPNLSAFVDQLTME